MISLSLWSGQTRYYCVSFIVYSIKRIQGAIINSLVVCSCRSQHKCVFTCRYICYVIHTILFVLQGGLLTKINVVTNNGWFWASRYLISQGCCPTPFKYSLPYNLTYVKNTCCHSIFQIHFICTFFYFILFYFLWNDD